MTVNAYKDKAVVVVNKQDVVNAFGFPHIYSAIAFVERQIAKPQLAFESVQEAMGKGVEIDGASYSVMDVETYTDLFLDSDEEDEDNE